MITGLIIVHAIVFASAIILASSLIRGLSTLVRESGAAVFLWQNDETDEPDHIATAGGRP